MTEIAAARALIRRPPWYRRPEVIDLVVFAVAALAAVTEACLIALGSSHGGYAALAVSAVGLLVARRLRWLGLVLTAVAPLADAALGYEPLVLWTITVFTCFSVTLRGTSAVAVSFAAGAPVYLAIVLAGQTGFVNPEAFTALALVVAAGAAGSAVHSRQDYWDEQERRAQDAALAREREIDGRVTEERLRIARDLHDVVGHEIAALGIHLGVLEVNLPKDADRAWDALAAARQDVKSVLHETQRILQILRTDDDAADASRPAPSYEGITTLVATATADGSDIDADLCDLPERIDPEVGSAAFRIVQECITNFQRHGSGALRLTTTVDRGVLRIEAQNDVSPGRQARSGGRTKRGYGLTGMRERAASAGGGVTVDQSEEAFAVTALLPVDGVTS